MSNVSVSRDALHSVKAAFRDFQTSVEASTDHMKSHAEDIITSTRTSIKKQQAIVESLKSKVTSLSADIEQCQAQIISNNNQLSSLKGSIANASSRNNGLDNQIAQLNAQKQRLLSQNSSNSDNGNDNSAQIHAIENQIQSCERQRRQLNEQIASMRSQESSLNAQNAKLRDDKTRLDSALATAKNEHSKAIQKSEKLKSAGTTVESSINSFLGIAQQFKQTAMTTSSTSQSGIEKCIAAIDEYEAVNLNGNSGASAGSMNTAVESVQIAEMEENNEFDIPDIEVANAPRVHTGQLLTSSPMTFDIRVNTDNNPLDSYAWQILMQEDGLNNLTVSDYLYYFESRAANGRGTGTYQRNQRLAYLERMADDILFERLGVDANEEGVEVSAEDSANAFAEARESILTMDALHNPDQGLGGSVAGVTAIGSRSVNRALGPILRAALRDLYPRVLEASTGMTQDEMEHTYLNVQLNTIDANE